MKMVHIKLLILIIYTAALAGCGTEVGSSNLTIDEKPVVDTEASPQTTGVSTAPEAESITIEGYFSLEERYNGATVAEIPKQDNYGITTETWLIISIKNDDGTISTSLLEIEMSSDGKFYGKDVESYDFAEYGVLMKHGVFCTVNVNTEGFEQAIYKFLRSAPINPQALPLCSQI